MFKDPKQILVTYTLQLLLVMLLYPIPEQPGVATPKNFYRHFLGRLHRPQDFQFIVDGMTRILNQPLQTNASYLPGTQAFVKFAPEIIMLFWEITQCNKRFRSFIVDTERAHDFIILILFYALEYKGDASKQGVVRMCAFLLQTLSVEKNFGVNLNKTFEAQDTLPPAIRIAGFRGTYADFLIQVNLPLLRMKMDTHHQAVDLHPYHQQSRETDGNLPRFVGCYQQYFSTSRRVDGTHVPQNYATLQLHVLAVIPSSQ